jgi:polygalacturonase
MAISLIKSACDARMHGAIGNGVADDTAALQRALDVCAQSGGTVHVPPGRYLTGTLRLRANTTLDLAAGAVLLGSGDESLYPVIAPTPSGSKPGRIQALLWADRVDRWAVTGRGAIDMQGRAMTWAEAGQTAFRPATLFMEGCHDVSISGVSFLEPCFWTIHPKHCVNVDVSQVTIVSSSRRPNTDGIDPDGCQNVRIRDCDMDTGDDCICLKSTAGRVCENITVENCRLRTACAALKIGTEALGPVRHVRMAGCIIRDSAVGIALYMKDGSVYEDMQFENIDIESPGEFPLFIDITPRDYRDPAIGTIRSIGFEGIRVTSPGRFYAEGHAKQPIEDLAIHNLTWNVTAPLDWSKPKPAGAARVCLDPSARHYENRRAQFVIAHAVRPVLRDITVTKSFDGSWDRNLCCLENVVQEQIGGLTGGK